MAFFENSAAYVAAVSAGGDASSPIVAAALRRPSRAHQRNRMAGESFSETLERIVELDLRDGKRVEPYDLVAHGNIASNLQRRGLRVTSPRRASRSTT